MEIFPSMTYEDIMKMPYKDFRTLRDIRVERKNQEQKELDNERKRQEEKTQREIASKRSSQMRATRRR